MASFFTGGMFYKFRMLKTADVINHTPMPRYLRGLTHPELIEKLQAVNETITELIFQHSLHFRDLVLRSEDRECEGGVVGKYIYTDARGRVVQTVRDRSLSTLSDDELKDRMERLVDARLRVGQENELYFEEAGRRLTRLKPKGNRSEEYRRELQLRDRIAACVRSGETTDGG